MLPRFVVLLISFIGPCLLVGQDASSPVWTDFLNWYRSYKGLPHPPEVMKSYSAKLASSGTSDADIRQTLSALQKIAAASPRDMLAIHFNKIFTEHPEVFSQEPNAFLKRVAAGLKPGKALDVGMGQGRNLVYLAANGWDSTGYDISDAGLAIARSNAGKAGVPVRAVLASHNDFDYGKAQWDLIVMTYAFVNMEDRSFLTRVKDSLRPGGIVLVEQLNSGGTSPGPANALFRSFEDLRILEYHDAVDTAEWSGNKARIGRIVAQKQ